MGGGRMGSGVAHAFLTSGWSVIVIESDAAQASSAQQRVAALVEASAKRGVLTEAVETVLARLRTSTEISDVAGSAAVIEAVPEIPEVKVDLLRKVEAVVSADAVIASNTSSISIDLLAGALAHPERFLGMHFFNPVPASKLVEVIRGSATDAAAVEFALRATEEIGKTPIVVGDSPGFATSRLGLALGLEAIRMVEEGVASAADIDNGMVLGYKHPVGPLRLTDMVGLDVRLGIARYLHAELGERFAPPQLLIAMVERGELGMKSGRGFYEWPAD
jgi:3-hydroxybutyryl-CoA dehydrogenase